MLKECKMYYAQCDKCKKTYSSDIDESLFLEPSDAAEEIIENGWIIKEDRCYCPDCK